MKTLLFTIEYPPFKGGVANYYGNLVDHWPEKDNIFVLNNNDNKLVKKWSFPKWLPACSALRKEIKKHKIDHIIVGHILPLGTIAYRFSLFRKTTYSVILHGMDFEYSQKSWRKRFLSKLILKNAKSIICVNSYTAYLVKKAVNNHEKIIVANPGAVKQPANTLAIKNIKEKYDLDNKITMLSVGRLVKRKGHDQIIKVMPEALKSVPGLHYYIAGDGPDRLYLENLAKDKQNITFLGKISDEDKLAWMESCDFFAMPSRNIDGDFEGFGIVYMEAAMAGKAVLAGESGGVKDAVQGGVTGILVDPQNSERIVNAIIKLAKEPETRNTLGKNALARAEKDFNWSDKIKKIYNAIN